MGLVLVFVSVGESCWCDWEGKYMFCTMNMSSLPFPAD